MWKIHVYDTELGPEPDGGDDYVVPRRTMIQAFVIFDALTRGLQLEASLGTFGGIADIHCLEQSGVGVVVKLVSANGLTYELSHDGKAP